MWQRNINQIDWGPNPQPKHVPWLEINPGPFALRDAAQLSHPSQGKFTFNSRGEKMGIALPRRNKSNLKCSLKFLLINQNENNWSLFKLLKYDTLTLFWRDSKSVKALVQVPWSWKDNYLFSPTSPYLAPADIKYPSQWVLRTEYYEA